MAEKFNNIKINNAENEIKNNLIFNNSKIIFLFWSIEIKITNIYKEYITKINLRVIANTSKVVASDKY